MNLSEPPGSQRSLRDPVDQHRFPIVRAPHSAALARLSRLEVVEDRLVAGDGAAGGQAVPALIGGVEEMEGAQSGAHAAAAARQTHRAAGIWHERAAEESADVGKL